MLGSAAAPAAGAGDAEAGASRKGRGSRRETWCPGRSAWEPPLQGALRGDGTRRGARLTCLRRTAWGGRGSMPRHTQVALMLTHWHATARTRPQLLLGTRLAASAPRRATACCCRPCLRATRTARPAASSACASATRPVGGGLQAGVGPAAAQLPGGLGSTCRGSVLHRGRGRSSASTAAYIEQKHTLNELDHSTEYEAGAPLRRSAGALLQVGESGRLVLACLQGRKQAWTHVHGLDLASAATFLISCANTWCSAPPQSVGEDEEGGDMSEPAARRAERLQAELE